jgi:hypothetical protein
MSIKRLARAKDVYDDLGETLAEKSNDEVIVYLHLLLDKDLDPVDIVDEAVRTVASYEDDYVHDKTISKLLTMLGFNVYDMPDYGDADVVKHIVAEYDGVPLEDADEYALERIVADVVIVDVNTHEYGNLGPGNQGVDGWSLIEQRVADATVEDASEVMQLVLNRSADMRRDFINNLMSLARWHNG